MIDVVYSNMKHKNSFAHLICKEHLYIVNVVMFFPKNFYLIDAINKNLGELLSSGIVTHLIDKYIDMRYWNIKQARRSPQVLTFLHIRGTFMLWILLCALALIVFLIELLWQDLKNKRPLIVFKRIL